MTSRTDYIARLRKLADMLEAKAELILPYTIRPDEIQFFPNGAAQTAATAKLLPTSWAKNDPNLSEHHKNYYILTGEWEGVTLTILETRSNVCERVQVGTERVVVPAVEAAPETVERRPVFEYRCEPLLAKAVAS